MFNIALILLVSAEFCFYLLIAQTGIVEYFHSDLAIIGFLPVGAVLGTIGSLFVDFRYKFHLLIFIQALLMLFYPNLNSFMLFIMGMSMGAVSVMIIEILKRASREDMMVALMLSYTIGTLLFNSEIEGRWIVGLVFSLIVFISAFFISFKPHVGVSFMGTLGQPQGIAPTNWLKFFKQNTLQHSIWLMFIWVFLDSTLFESLSRNLAISIWRDGYTLEIALFHIIGVAVAIKFSLNTMKQQLIIATSFALSYMLYIANEPLLLSIIYPFVISFYNVVILQTLIKENSFIKLSLYMILIGWGASGMGLLFALNHWVAPLFALIFAMGIYSLKDSIKFKQRSQYGLA